MDQVSTKQCTLDHCWPISLECHWCPVDLFCSAEHAQSTRFISLLRRSSSTHSLANASNKGQLPLARIFWGSPTACKTKERRDCGNQHLLSQSSQASSTSASVYARLWAPLPRASFPGNPSSVARRSSCSAEELSQPAPLSSLSLNSGCPPFPPRQSVTFQIFDC